MDQAFAQQDLEAVMANLLPLVSFVSTRSCEESSLVLLKLLGEALEGQEASSKRGAELKTLKVKDLLNRLTPGREKVVAATVASGEGTPTKPKAPFGEEKKQQQKLQGAGLSHTKKRTRKMAEKAGDGMYHEEDEDDEEDGRKRLSEKKPKKKAAKNGLKVAVGAWDGEGLPRIAKMVKCEGDGLDFRMDVYV